MITKNLKTLEDFQALKKGDILVCKFHRDTYKLAKRTRFASYEVQENKIHQKEIILQKQNNVSAKTNALEILCKISGTGN